MISWEDKIKECILIKNKQYKNQVCGKVAEENLVKAENVLDGKKFVLRIFEGEEPHLLENK